MELIDPPAEMTAERTIVLQDPRASLTAVVAIDDTVMGPGFGGVRMRPYASLGAAMREAQRLAAAMTLKNTLASIPYGGAKSVVMYPDGDFDRLRLVNRFGEMVADLGGKYLPGVDMGTTPADMRIMAAAGADATCTDEDPSPFTASGVQAAIRSAVYVGLDGSSLSGVRVLVQGVGNVGASLARGLHAEGAIVDVADVDQARANELAAELGGRNVPLADVLTYDCDVFAPCAIARVINAAAVPGLKCRIIAGGANDTLDSEGDAQLLADRGVLFVPDFIANSGGVIWVHGQRSAWSDDTTREAIEAIGDRVVDVIERAREILDAAIEKAEASLVTAGTTS